MKISIIIALSLFIGIGNCLAQEALIDGNLIRLKGLKFDSKKGEIISKFGKPKKVFEPNSECGFRSEAEQGKKYYQMEYDHVAFVGNDTEGYGIESIDFNQRSNLTLEYGKHNFTHKLTKDEFSKIFGKATKTGFDDRGNGVTDVLMFFKNGDDGLIFSFKSGYLIKIEYWSPC